MFQSPFVTYSQNGEDVLLWRALKGVQRGFYIDVGAQDPIEDSVTKAFYLRGWHGINIEPVRYWHDRLIQDRPHDINLRLAVADHPGVIQLFEVERSGLSTSDPEFAHRHQAGGHTLHEQSVECATLDQICADNDVRTVHFLKIDCEGGEKAALEGFALSEVRPWIILVEATEPNSSKPTWHEWEHLLTKRGYRFVFFDGLNRYYVANEHMDLAPAFDAPVNVFDSARRFSDVNTQKRADRLQAEVEGLRGAAVVAQLQAEVVAANTRRDELMRERDAAAAERDMAMAERVRIAAARDAFMAQRDAAMTERDTVMAERDDLRARQSAAQYQASVRQSELDRLQARQAELLASHSWRITAPLRGCSHVARGALRRLRRMLYVALRPFAHAARPVMHRLAASPAVRRVATGTFGKHSRLLNTARLFLFGPPMNAPVVENITPPEAAPEDVSLSARGREVLSTLREMGTAAKGEPRHARHP